MTRHNRSGSVATREPATDLKREGGIIGNRRVARVRSPTAREPKTAAITARVPHSTRAGSRTCGEGPCRASVTGQVYAAEFAALSGTLKLVPSSEVRRERPRQRADPYPLWKVVPTT
ncbi:hypothetical protein GCM10027073_35900 [Streptomyces chlorus]